MGRPWGGPCCRDTSLELSRCVTNPPLQGRCRQPHLGKPYVTFVTLTSKSIRVAVGANRTLGVAVDIHGTTIYCAFYDTRVSERPKRRAPFGSQASRREALQALGFASRPHDRFALSSMRRRQAPADCAATPGIGSRANGLQDETPPDGTLDATGQEPTPSRHPAHCRTVRGGPTPESHPFEEAYANASRPLH
jgi:hypothetical protein